MELYYEPREILNEISKEATPEMSAWQSSYLCGLIKEYRPSKILEVGVSAGGTTALILNTMNLIGGRTELWSVDISENYYAKPWLKTGFMAEEAKDIIGRNKVVHHLKIGMVPEVIDDIGGEIDFLILDTVHMVPGEILDFPICLPYLKKDAIVVLHDVILHATTRYTYNYATQLLLDCVTAEKIPVFGVDTELGYPNIAAFRINDDTKKYIYDVFSALLLPWMYNIPDKEIEVYRNKYKQLNYSSECLEVFEKSVLANKNVIKTRMINNLSKYREIAKTCTMLAGKKVYIYGAGEVGHYILNIIEDVIDFKGFVVSEDQDHDEGVYDLTSLEKIIEDDAIVYVAVSPDKMDIIKINIEKSDIKNVEYMDINLFECIYEA